MKSLQEEVDKESDWASEMSIGSHTQRRISDQKSNKAKAVLALQEVANFDTFNQDEVPAEEVQQSDWIEMDSWVRNKAAWPQLLRSSSAEDVNLNVDLEGLRTAARSLADKEVAHRLLLQVFRRYVTAAKRHMNLSRFLRFMREFNLTAASPTPAARLPYLS